MTKTKNMVYSKIQYGEEIKIEYKEFSQNSLQILNKEREAPLTQKFLHFYGPLGSLSLDLKKIDPYGLAFFSIQNQSKDRNLEIFVKKNGTGESLKTAKGISGSLFSLCKKSIQGVKQGFVLFLELHGVGYKANILESNNGFQTIEFKLGQSHDILYTLPSSVKAFSVKPTQFGLYGINHQQIGQIGASIRSLRPPEPYKGKGIRYKDEIIKLKVGKKK
jgi:large subunit ribosomal protein L6